MRFLAILLVSAGLLAVAAQAATVEPDILYDGEDILCPV